MESIKEDSRFSHITSDPRFRLMPKSKKKVKIDSRFQSIFTSNDFSHRSDIDKRGRPMLNGSKKQKHVMERFYDLSDSDSEQEKSGSSDKEEVSPKLQKQEKRPLKRKQQTKETTNKAKKSKTVKSNKDDDEGGECNNEDNEVELDKKSSSKKVKKGGKVKKVNIEEGSEDDNDIDNDEEEDIEEENDYDMSEDNDEDFVEEGDDSGVEDEEELDADIIEYTQDYEIEETGIDHRWNELHADATDVSESTSRLAVCNMDWDFVKAQDLFVLFKSFVPEGGAVKSVTIYPSEFGKERMAEEALLGPRELRKENGGDNGDGEKQTKKGKKKKNNNHGGDKQKAKREDKEKASTQTEKLREYQLNRLRYYYAVVDCDSVRTADNIYTECDGREYQLSSVRLDLRFIPEDMTFDDEPKESFSEGETVVDYKPSDFNSTALSQAKVEVTWDETDFDRLSKRMTGLQQKELESIVEENKYADIIAPPESDSEVEGEADGRPEWLRNLLGEGGDDEEEIEEKKTVTEEEKIKLYRKLLMDKAAEEEDAEKEEEGEFDKEIAWQPGLKSEAEKKMKKQEKKKKEENDLVGDYLDKKKEKRKKKRDEKLKKRKQKEDGSDDDDDQNNEDAAFSDDDLPAGFDIQDMKDMLGSDNDDDLPQLKATKKGKKTEKKGKSKGGNRDNDDGIDEKIKAELELILMDEDSGLQKKPAKPTVVKDSDTKKSRKKKKKELAKLKKAGMAEKDEDFDLDVADPRFSALYSSHHFHIDPTAPQFKKTKNMLKLVDEQIKRKKVKKGGNDGSSVEDRGKGAALDGSVGSNTKSTSQVLLDSLKRKMKNGAKK